ncbi:hypothetical protein [Sporomusa acidovorans]|uniref:Cupin domain protein n=1 Tax=Sporomusa acidovorans (strain ATCC 49682 / DSM 3132 / Mol) TaxID=1123286 RepID=A0ABZ3J0H2_SPOA4|nr:hypothetical protein [Sporomusa acidovorans]OZC21329.1 hypothetical protein SPACI_19560 [Sporomusa acidovorans DSM 3132]SDE57226.1 hypothetical protein SAMN04488499_101683 [Sporomusa acidovorans]
MVVNCDGKYGKFIIQNLHDPNLGSVDFQAMYKKFAKRVLWMDSNVVEGAFQMNTAWYFAVPAQDPVFEEHVHDYDELIGFFGSNPNDPYELGAEIEVTINGERHFLTRTSMIFVPAGMRHMPLSIKKVNRPVFHFSIVMHPEYSGGGAYK